MNRTRFFVFLLTLIILTLTFWGCSFFPGSSDSGTTANPLGPAGSGSETPVQVPTGDAATDMDNISKAQSSYNSQLESGHIEMAKLFTLLPEPNAQILPASQTSQQILKFDPEKIETILNEANGALAGAVLHSLSMVELFDTVEKSNLARIAGNNLTTNPIYGKSIRALFGFFGSTIKKSAISTGKLVIDGATVINKYQDVYRTQIANAKASARKEIVKIFRNQGINVSDTATNDDLLNIYNTQWAWTRSKLDVHLMNLAVSQDDFDTLSNHYKSIAEDVAPGLANIIIKDSSALITSPVKMVATVGSDPKIKEKIISYAAKKTGVDKSTIEAISKTRDLYLEVKGVYKDVKDVKEYGTKVYNLMVVSKKTQEIPIEKPTIQMTTTEAKKILTQAKNKDLIGIKAETVTAAAQTLVNSIADPSGTQKSVQVPQRIHAETITLTKTQDTSSPNFFLIKELFRHLGTLMKVQ